MAPVAETTPPAGWSTVVRQRHELLPKGGRYALGCKRPAMTRLNLILLSLLVVCSVSVVTAQHRARKVFMELTQEQEAAAALEVEFDRLRLEQRTWGMHSRIEKVARQDLRMHTPTADGTRVLSLDGVALQR